MFCTACRLCLFRTNPRPKTAATAESRENVGLGYDVPAGNRVATGGHCVTVKGFQGAQILNVIDEGHGIYRVDYVVHIPKSLLQEIGVDILKRLDLFALATRSEPNASLPEEAAGFGVSGQRPQSGVRAALASRTRWAVVV